MLFSEVYELCKRIPKGKVSTYKDIAEALDSKAYRLVGQALRCNPYAPEVPCHRVVKVNGEIGGFKGEIEGEVVQEKVELLESEGVKVVKGKVDLKKCLHRF